MFHGRPPFVSRVLLAARAPSRAAPRHDFSGGVSSKRGCCEGPVRVRRFSDEDPEAIRARGTSSWPTRRAAALGDRCGAARGPFAQATSARRPATSFFSKGRLGSKRAPSRGAVGRVEDGRAGRCAAAEDPSREGRTVGRAVASFGEDCRAAGGRPSKAGQGRRSNEADVRRGARDEARARSPRRGSGGVDRANAATSPTPSRFLAIFIYFARVFRGNVRPTSERARWLGEARLERTVV